MTRRDAVAALSALGVTGVGAAGIQHYTTDSETDGEESRVDIEAAVETLIAAAEVLYPSAVDDVTEFVETFVVGRLGDSSHAEGLTAAVEAIEKRAQSWYGGSFRSLSMDDRESLLREMGTDSADEDPEGSTAEQVRYYVVNELLLALYASPTGGELVGIENPQGYAGGIDSYQRGPGVLDGGSATPGGGPGA